MAGGTTHMTGTSAGAVDVAEEGRYFASESPDDFEHGRLELLGKVANPITTRRLDGLGIGPGWRCLEVGAGEGGIARWMADRVGPIGRVVAADIDTRFLDG